jgi:hypothetical protein
MRDRAVQANAIGTKQLMAQGIVKSFNGQKGFGFI